jgi:hypothetical protein
VAGCNNAVVWRQAVKQSCEETSATDFLLEQSPAYYTAFGARGPSPSHPPNRKTALPRPPNFKQEKKRREEAQKKRNEEKQQEKAARRGVVEPPKNPT